MGRRVLHDEYFKRAKAEGYRSRAAYKLLQIQESRSLVKPGDRVLDLGCAPGSWLQVAADLVGPEGEVLGIDLQGCVGAFAGWAAHRVADVEAVDPQELIDHGRGGLFDVVLSDMGPKTTGHNDHLVSARLFDSGLALAMKTLKPGGHIAFKVLEGSEYRRLLDDVGSMFARCKGFKPKASRSVSREMYIIGEGYTPPTSA